MWILSLLRITFANQYFISMICFLHARCMSHPPYQYLVKNTYWETTYYVKLPRFDF
jgi:hypothetical protein